MSFDVKQWNPVQLLSLLHLSSTSSSQQNVLPQFQPTLTRRTSGHCLGNFIAVNLALPPVLNIVSHTATHFLFSLSFDFKRVNEINICCIRPIA
jgi:hypothetical protein